MFQNFLLVETPQSCQFQGPKMKKETSLFFFHKIISALKFQVGYKGDAPPSGFNSPGDLAQAP